MKELPNWIKSIAPPYYQESFQTSFTTFNGQDPTGCES
jgi:hypothetical protein